MLWRLYRRFSHGGLVPRLAVLLVTGLIAGLLVTLSSPAMARSPEPWVTVGEYRFAKPGMGMRRVHQRFDIKGQIVLQIGEFHPLPESALQGEAQWSATLLRHRLGAEERPHGDGGQVQALSTERVLELPVVVGRPVSAGDR